LKIERGLAGIAIRKRNTPVENPPLFTNANAADEWRKWGE